MFGYGIGTPGGVAGVVGGVKKTTTGNRFASTVKVAPGGRRGAARLAPPHAQRAPLVAVGIDDPAGGDLGRLGLGALDPEQPSVITGSHCRGTSADHRRRS